MTNKPGSKGSNGSSGSSGSSGSGDDRSLDLFQEGPVSDKPEPTEVTEVSLADFAERAYLDYAVSVVKGRAIPDLCDGMKPVQRRILFAMDQMGLGNAAKPVKSARVVGDVLGKYHPHGDQSAYDALVRLAQSFSMRYPLIDGQGNFGSRDGDGAAAMRYTEARLTAFSELLLSEIDEGTVDFGPNYDGSFREPLRLPARLPVCLLNGASGIAVGMATEIPPHNLHEVSAAVRLLLEQSVVTDEELLACIAGPDFPGGGQITSAAEEIQQVYRQGRGSLKLRARWVFEELARAQWQLIITELPHGVSSQRILEEIEELTNPKIKAGKKSLSPDQQQTKQLMLSYCESVRDESGKEAAVRLVFEPKTSRIDRDEFARLLLAQTSLETSFSANLVAVDTQGRPRSLSLTEMLRQWVDFRLLTVRRRSAYRLEIAQRRIHILEGRVIALASIDEVIAVIRESDEPKPALVARFGLSELQAEDILELRLRQLARLEAIKIEKELSALREQADKLSQILDSERTLRKTVSKEVAEDTKRFADARRTLVKAELKATVEIPVVDDPVTVVVSVNGWVRSRQGHGHDEQGFSFKTGDSLYAAFECRTTDQLVALSATGRAYSVSVASLPGFRGEGLPLTSFFELDTGGLLTHFLVAPSQTMILLASRLGYGFMARFDALVGRNRSGKQFISFEQGDSLAVFKAMGAHAGAMAVVTAAKRLLVFGLNEFKELSNGGRGVQLVDLDAKDDYVLDADVISDKGLDFVGQGRTGKPQRTTLSRDALLDYVAHRGRKGKKLDLRMTLERIESTGLSAGSNNGVSS